MMIDYENITPYIWNQYRCLLRFSIILIMLWLIKFPLLLHWVVVAVKYVRLDEGERLFDSSVTALFPNLLKSSKEIETILTFDLKSLVNSPSEVIKIK